MEMNVKALMKLAKRVNVGDQHTDGVLKTIVCRSLRHEERRTLKHPSEHADVIGTFTGTEMPVMVCPRCSDLDNVEVLGKAQVLREARESLAAKLNLTDEERELMLTDDVVDSKVEEFRRSLVK